MKNSRKLSLVLIWAITVSVRAEVVTDGTVGAVQSLSNQMVIPQSLGTTVGNNLFHSFQTFNINTGESATFTGSSTLQNVISRVTGGQVSTIDGLLKSEVGSANFYFINPAGVTFGENAQLDVPAAFHVSTADHLKFADGTEFSASNPSASTLTIAEPAAFGFLENSPANHGSISSGWPSFNLSVKNWQTLDLVAGNLNLSGHELVFETDNCVDLSCSRDISVIEFPLFLNAPAGEIRLVAFNGAGDVSVLKNSDGKTPLPESTPTASNAGNIILEKSNINADGNGSGRIGLWGNTIAIDNSSLTTINKGDLNANSSKGVEIKAHSLALKSSIASEAQSSGNAGAININVDSLDITSFHRGLGLQEMGGVISSSTSGTGNAGNININANTLNIDGRFVSGRLVGIFSEAKAGSTGDAADIAINANSLTVAYGGIISSTTSSNSNAGNIAVSANNVTFDVGSIASQTSGKGDSGNISINTNSLDLLRWAYLVSSANGAAQGKAGDVSVQAENINIKEYSRIGSTFSSFDNGGNINLHASNLNIENADIFSLTDININVSDTLNLLNHGKISAFGNANLNTQAAMLNINANAGIFAEAGNIQVNTGGLDILSSGKISTASLNTAIPQLGNVNVTADVLNLLFGAEISSQAHQNAYAGNVAVVANNLTVDKGNFLYPQWGGIFTNSDFSPRYEGNVSVTAPHPVIFNPGAPGAGITTDGAVGAVQSFTGENITIPQSLGTTVGNNLFHSFAKFNVDAGQSVFFNGSDGLKNVISRVTGGDVSTISGWLSSNIAHANFYFLNPAGMFFGAGATLDVPAAFHFSTAQSLRFANQQEFSKSSSDISQLLSEPVSFVFSDSSNGNIVVNGAKFPVYQGQLFDINANSIDINNTTLSAPNGEIRLVALKGQAELATQKDSSGKLALPTATPSAVNSGNITMNNSTITSDGNGSGRVGLWGYDISLDNHSSVTANNNGELNADSAKGVDVHAENLTLGHVSKVSTDTRNKGSGANVQLDINNRLEISNGSVISSSSSRKNWDAIASGNGGDIALNAKAIKITSPYGGYGESSWGPIFSTGVFSESDSSSEAGSITINTDSLEMLGGKVSSSNTEYSHIGKAGNLNIAANQLKINGQYFGGIDNWSSRDQVGLFSSQQGFIKINSDTIEIINGGQISSSATANKAGDIDIAAHAITLESKAGIFVNARNGEAGKITINSDSLDIFHASQVSASVSGGGKAGDVYIKTNNLRIKDYDALDIVFWFTSETAGGFTVVPAGIFSQQNFLGENLASTAYTPGKITVISDSLEITNGGRISTNTETLGDAGQIDIIANLLNIDRQNSSASTGIFSSSENITPWIGNTGNAGTITLHINDSLNINAQNQSGSIYVVDRNIVGISSSATSTSVGKAGTVTVHAKSINMINKGQISSDTKSTAVGHLGKAGDLAIHATEKITLENQSEISSSTFGVGHAGSITVTAPVVAINNASISAAAALNSSGQTGDVTVIASNNLQLANHAKISVKNDAVVLDPTLMSAGLITVSAPDIVLTDSAITAESTGNVDAGNIVANFSQALRLDPSYITTSANLGNGGNITVNGSGVISLQNSGFLTSVTGITGNGGNIAVSASSLIMDNGVIQANAVGGSGGEINLNLKALISNQNQLIKGGTQVIWQPFIFGFNLIQAASASGINGSVNISSPQFNISGSISGLDSVALVLPSVEHSSCQNASDMLSSLARGGKGGIPDDGLQFSFIPTFNLQETPQQPQRITTTYSTNKNEKSPPCLAL